MAYTSGSIIDINPGLRLLEAVEAGFGVHDNWDFIEQVTIGTVNYRVWKNRGAGLGANSFGQDFHVALYQPESLTSLYFKVFESWDAVNKKAIRPCKSTQSLVPNANFSWGDEVNGYILSSASITHSGFQSLSTTGLDWFLQVSANQINIGAKQSTSDGMISFGVFESLIASGDPFPLYLKTRNGPLVTSDSTYTNTYAWSRHPTVTIGQTYNFIGHNASITPTVGGVGTTDNDRFHGGAILYSRVLMTAHQSGARPSYGYARGMFYDTILLAGVGSARNGDTITIAGDVYVVFFDSSTRFFVKRDAV